MTDTLRDRLGALVRERIVNVLSRHKIEYIPFSMTKKSRRWSCACDKWGEKDDIVDCLNAAREHIADELEAALAAQPAPAVMGEGDALFKLSRQVAADYSKHAGSDDLCELESEECLADFLYRALAAHTAAAESREEACGKICTNCQHSEHIGRWCAADVYDYGRLRCQCGSESARQPGESQ